MDLVVDPFENTRDRHQYRRPDRQQVVSQQGDSPVVGNRCTGHHRQVIPSGALERVRKRQKREEQVIGVATDHLQTAIGVPEDILVTQHDPFGASGGTRGVDDGSQSVFVSGGAHQLRRIGQPLAGSLQSLVHLPCAVDVSETDYAVEKSKFRHHRLQAVPVFLAADEQQLGARILQDISRVFGPILGVKRYQHQPIGKRRLVEHHPFRAILHHHRHPVARLQILTDQRRLPARNLCADCSPGQVCPALALLIIEAIRQRVWGTLSALVEQACKGACLLGTDDMLIRFLAHRFTRCRTAVWQRQTLPPSLHLP